ncbi:MAG: cation transporter, partial [Methanobacteriaceae archaeon]|nr:cation transporter [Methanobacteriaceae archaeon]
MAENKPVLGYDKFLMMALSKGGSLSLDELWEKSILFLSLIWYQQLPEKGQPLTERLFFTISQMRSKLEDGMTKEASQGTKEEMDKLINDGWIKLNDDNKYELTPEGLIKAEKYVKNMKKDAAIANKELKPSTTAKNTTFLDAFLAVLKLGSGLISGSIGLIADGT